MNVSDLLGADTQNKEVNHILGEISWNCECLIVLFCPGEW